MKDLIIVSTGITYHRSALISYFAKNNYPKKLPCVITGGSIYFFELNFKTSIVLKNLIRNGAIDVERLECPISRTLMNDPITLSTGITYDRVSITNWFNHRQICPMTGKRFAKYELNFKTSVNIMQVIEEYKKTQPTENRQLNWFLRWASPRAIVSLSILVMGIMILLKRGFYLQPQPKVTAWPYIPVFADTMSEQLKQIEHEKMLSRTLFFRRVEKNILTPEELQEKIEQETDLLGSCKI